MEKAFLNKQAQDLNLAFEFYEKNTSRNIKSLAPGQCLAELASIPVCKALVNNLIAAAEIGAENLIEEIFFSLRQSKK